MNYFDSRCSLTFKNRPRHFCGNVFWGNRKQMWNWIFCWGRSLLNISDLSPHLKQKSLIQLTYGENIHTPSVYILQDPTQIFFVRRFHPVGRKPLAGEAVRVMQRFFVDAGDLEHGVRTSRLIFSTGTFRRRRFLLLVDPQRGDVELLLFVWIGEK